MKRITTKSGIKGYECKLQDNYSSFEEFDYYSEYYNLSKKLGFETAMEAWEANPTIQGSTNPDDFRIAPSTPVNEVKDKQPEINKGNTPLWKELNGKRTQGFLKVDYDHSKAPLTLATGNLNTGLDWEGVASAWKENDAKYICMAYNNLASLAEALQAFVNDIDNHPSYSAREHYKPLMDKAKQALSRIS